MTSKVKNIVFLFLFVVVSVIAAKWIGEKVPAIGKYTSTI